MVCSNRDLWSQQVPWRHTLLFTSNVQILNLNRVTRRPLLPGHVLFLRPKKLIPKSSGILPRRIFVIWLSQLKPLRTAELERLRTVEIEPTYYQWHPTFTIWGFSCFLIDLKHEACTATSPVALSLFDTMNYIHTDYSRVLQQSNVTIMYRLYRIIYLNMLNHKFLTWLKKYSPHRY